jgi:glycolate oxidase FAD binding subunit
MLGKAGDVIEIEAEQSRRLWREIRDCKPFADGTQKPIWRVSMAPGQGHRMLDALRREAGVSAYYDWQGGLMWLRMEADPEAGTLRAAIAHFGGGHATLIRAADAVRASAPVFQPQLPALAALSARLKEQFDPRGILNPGRMAAD